MAIATSTESKPVTTYVASQLLAIPLAGVFAWSLLSTGVPAWLAVAPWLGLSAFLARKRLPSEVLGVGLQVAAFVVVIVPLVPYLRELQSGAEVTAIDIATGFFGPAVVFALVAVVAYLVGSLLKRRARRKLTRRARKGARVQ